ncbi:hypothetical protein [Arenimonas sp.]|uniref:hypothetical protein n=1 Tax=Arenimonas sp. TaxID=1872635 RepID=UPI0035AD7BDF
MTESTASRLAAEWRGNPRLRLGAWLILGIVLLYGYLVLVDTRAAWRASLAQEVERVAKVRSLVGQEIWLERAETAAAARRALEQEIPAARTPGLAQAAAQARLRELTTPLGTGITLDVAGASPMPGRDGWVQVPATVSAPTVPLQRALQWVQAVESQPQLIVFDSLMLDNRDPARLSATLRAFYRIEAEPDADGTP